ncbi:MAG: DUF4292 domain-containing protein [Chitinophagaceae bacterium]|nr:DUF4292 domain-containing protein [Chitinophagaceae bacterium]
MVRFVMLLLLATGFFACQSTRKIKSAIAAIDTTHATRVDTTKTDSLAIAETIFREVHKNRVEFSSFSAKIKVEYADKNDKAPDLTVIARIKKDSAIWLSINATVFSYEAFRVLITRDSVKVLNKKDKLVTLRSIAYLQEVAQLPFDFFTLQDLVIGNPVFFSKNIVSVNQSNENTTVLSTGEFFKNLTTLGSSNYLVRSSKLDDINTMRNRTCYLSYGNYESKNGISFATRRTISISGNSKLDVDMDFKQYSFNENLVFPFNIPKNYKNN